MKVPKPLRVCTECGGLLDPGERCDCQDATAENTAPEAGAEAGQKATANPHEPVLAAAV